MPKSPIDGRVPALDPISGEYPFSQQDSSPSATVSWMGTVRAWIARRRERRAIQDFLMQVDDRFLKDMGVTRGRALREAAKPFWQR